MNRKNGCYDYDVPVLGKEFVVQDGYYHADDCEKRMARYISLQYAMSSGCKYAEHGYAKNDTGCAGCKNNC